MKLQGLSLLLSKKWSGKTFFCMLAKTQAHFYNATLKQPQRKRSCVGHKRAFLFTINLFFLRELGPHAYFRTVDQSLLGVE